MSATCAPCLGSSGLSSLIESAKQILELPAFRKWEGQFQLITD
jgi:hypothetical protein